MWRCVVLSLACAACTNPDDIIVVGGRVASSDPVEGQVVRLLRYLSAQRSIGASDPCALGTPLKEARADADGGYEFEVFRVETRNALCFRVDAQFPSGSLAWTGMPFYGLKTTLPTLHDWRPALGLDGGVLQFAPLVPWPDDELSARVRLTHREQLVTGDGGLAWQAEDRLELPDASSEFPGDFRYAREPLVLDGFRLEDFDGTLTLSAYLLDDTQEVSLISSLVLATRTTAGEKLELRGTRVPLSRGLACPELGTPCPLTDGELTEVDAGLIEEVSLNLAAPAAVSAAVLRGAWVADDSIRVLLAQADGGTTGEFEGRVSRGDPAAFGFDALFSGQRRDGGYARFRRTYLVIPLDAGVPISRVTLQFPSGLARIQEVSVFE